MRTLSGPAHVGKRKNNRRLPLVAGDDAQAFCASHARSALQWQLPREIQLYKPPAISHAVVMRKLILPLLLAPLFLAGCTSFTNLTPQRQIRNTNHLYPVEVAFNSRQQSLRWDSIQPYVTVGTDLYPMRPTSLMTNRWEALVSVPPGKNLVHYRYKFDFKYNAIGKPPQSDSAVSREYTLRILDR